MKGSAFVRMQNGCYNDLSHTPHLGVKLAWQQRRDVLLRLYRAVPLFSDPSFDSVRAMPTTPRIPLFIVYVKVKFVCQ